jgi:hypothetical protein
MVAAERLLWTMRKRVEHRLLVLLAVWVPKEGRPGLN